MTSSPTFERCYSGDITYIGMPKTVDSEEQIDRKRKRRSKHVPQRDDTFVRELRQFMKDQHYTQFDMAANLNCSQAKISHFLCCYMSEKAHNKMVELARQWKELTDHTAGLAERARRAYLSQMAQHHVKESGLQSQTSASSPQVEQPSFSLHHTLNSTSQKRCRDPSTIENPKQRVRRTCSEFSLDAPTSYSCSNNTVDELTDEALSFADDTESASDCADYVWVRRERSDSGYIAEDIAILQQQQESCRFELGAKRRSDWCLSCKKGNECMRRLTEADIALAKGLLAISRSPTPTQAFQFAHAHSVDTAGNLYTPSNSPTQTEFVSSRKTPVPWSQQERTTYSPLANPYNTTWSNDGIVFSSNIVVPGYNNNMQYEKGNTVDTMHQQRFDIEQASVTLTRLASRP
eukprot:CFRG0420T1